MAQERGNRRLQVWDFKYYGMVVCVSVQRTKVSSMNVECRRNQIESSGTSERESRPIESNELRESREEIIQ